MLLLFGFTKKDISFWGKKYYLSKIFLDVIAHPGDLITSFPFQIIDPVGQFSMFIFQMFDYLFFVFVQFLFESVYEWSTVTS